jgi:hypothetical protein
MWLYQNKEFTEENIGDYIGFVYCIKNLATGKLYIGRKLFTKAKTIQVKGKKKKTRVSSDWMEYYGSNSVLQEEVSKNGGQNYSREILHLCKTLSECAYLETKEIFVRDALLDDNYYNDWVSAKIRKAHLRSSKLYKSS